MPDEYKNFEPHNPTNIWYHKSDSNTQTGEIGRNTEMTQGETPDSGLNNRFTYNLENTHTDPQFQKSLEFSGVLKLDKKNGIWGFSDEDIKNGLLKKAQRRMSFLRQSDLNVNIDRVQGIITYDLKKVSAKILLRAEIEYIKIPFSNLDDGDYFHLEKGVMEGSFPGLKNNFKWTQLGDFTKDSPMVKKGPHSFWSKDQQMQVDLEFSMADAAKNSEFGLNVAKIKENNIDVYNKILETLGKNEIDWNDFFIKTTDNVLTYRQNPTISFEIDRPEKLPIYFTAFVVLIDKKAMPDYVTPIKDVSIGTLFTVPDAELRPESVREKYKPAQTKFIKTTEKQFILYTPGKFNPKDFDTEELSDINVTRKYADKIFTILPKGDEVTNWDRKEVSENMMVIEVGTEELKPKKQSTMVEFIESLFNKYTKTKDELGEHITVPEKQLQVEMSNKIEYDEFVKKERDENMETIGQTKVGAEEIYSWFHDNKGNIIFTK